MKLMNYKKIILFSIPLMFVLSCGKKGCTDPVAHNFDPSATKDDGTCFYGLNESSASFTFTPTSNPNVVVFTANNPDVECSWDFGNGTTSNLAQPADQIYDIPGQYIVQYTAYQSNAIYFLDKKKFRKNNIIEKNIVITMIR